MTASQEKFIRDSQKRLKASSLGRLQALQVEQTRWRRRQTFAQNKLADIAAKIEEMAEGFAIKNAPAEMAGDGEGSK